MPKKAYIGVSSKARRVKKIYIGISNKARRVRKGYIGVAGKARLFFAGKGTLVFREDYLESTQRSPAASNRSYAFVVGDSATKTFNATLTAGTTSALSVARSCQGTNAAGQYAVFGGRDVGGAATEGQTTVDAYNTSATRVSATEFPMYMRSYKAGYNDAYAVFGPGVVSQTPDTPADADVTVKLYDSSLTQTLVTSQDHGTGYCISNNGAHAIIFSGSYVYNSKVRAKYEVDAINTSGTVTALSDLSLGDGGNGVRGARAGNYALCTGGSEQGTVNGETRTDYRYKVHTYNQSLTRSIASPTSYSAQDGDGATADEDYGIFPTRDRYSNDVALYYEAYDSDLVKQIFERSGSGYGAYIPAATSFRNYGIFLRGRNDGSVDYTNVDVFEVT